MKARIGLTKTCLLGALLSSSALWVATGAFAQAGGSATGANAFDDGLPTSAAWPANVPPAGAAPIVGKAATAPVPYWWYHGTVEAGGRDFLNDPQSNGFKVFNGSALGKYYEYSDIKPGAFGNFDMATGTSDGLYQIEIGGVNVGYRDQSYFLDYSKAGEQYFTFTWDSTPHVYSTNARSPYVVSGSNVTLAPGIPAAATTAAALAPYAAPINLGIQRDTAAATYRWTPDEAWDVDLNYSHMSRTGTQPMGCAEGNCGTTDVQVQRPVNDTTQNYGGKAEYVGTSPWGKRFVVSAGYDGSQYTDSLPFYNLQEPAAVPTFALFSAWPSNQANSGSATLAADLPDSPWQSRYAGTLTYSAMTQNAALTPVAGSTYTPPTQSLDGDITTLLSNNVVTTKITPELTAKSSFRYYDFDNRTPEWDLGSWGMPDGNPGTHFVNTLSMGYIKTNAGEALNWRPDKYWNLGAEYGFERYDWTRADVNVTNQNSGKVFADYKPWSWLTSRASAEYSSRRYENYDYEGYVGLFQWPAQTSEQYSESQRVLMYDNRDIWTAHYQLDVVVFPSVTVTPWTKYQDAKYQVDPYTQQGLEDSNTWEFGIDGTYVVSPDLSLMAGYSASYAHQDLVGSTCIGAEPGSSPYGTTYCAAGGYANLANALYTNDRNVVNSFTTAVRYTPLPNKLDVDLRYTASYGRDDMVMLPLSNFEPGTSQFPENKIWYQRLDATAVYKFDQQQVAQLGWKGDVKFKLKYTWERNSETNWANDPLSPYTAQTMTDCGAGGCLWMGWYNPNYNVHMLAASLVASW